MADTFGAVPVPIPPPCGEEPVSDPALGHLAAFVRAVLNADAAGAWSRVARTQPVNRIFTHDPEKVDVSDRDFPAVFVWREASNPVRVADDWMTDTALFEILWLFEPAPQLKQARRAPFLNGILKPLMRAFHVGRHPAWVLAGDTDPRAQTRGSLLWKHCGFMRELVRNPMLSGLTVQMYEGDKLRTYDGVKLSIEAIEKLDRDPSVGTSPSRLSADVTNGSAAAFPIHLPLPDPEG